MNYLSSLLFVGALSILNLMILASLYILDFSGAASKQKIIFIRIGLIITCIVTLIFYMMQFLSFNTLEIILPDKIINQLSVNSILPIVTKPFIDWSFYLFIAYVSGFFIMLSRIVLSYLKASRQLADSNKRHIQEHDVLLSKNIHSPLSFGFPKGKIYLPFNTTEKWTAREIEMCLAHEQIHVDQNDTLWKLISLMIEALLYFAPWAHFMHKKFELEMEIFCDEQTRARTKASIQEYGGLLLTMTPIQPNQFIFTNIKTSTLKRRVLAMKSKSTHRPLLVSALSMVLLFAGGTAIATSNEVLVNKSIFKVTSNIWVDGKLVSSPQIVAYANQKAVITLSSQNGQHKLKLSLIAKAIAKDNIKVNYDIQYNDGNGNIHSKPELILVPNQEGVIQIASDSGHSYEMKVIAVRQ